MPQNPRHTGPLATTIAPVRGFFGGVGLLFKGFRLWGTSPKLMLIGAIPALVVGVVYVALVVTLLVNIGGIATWVTPFAEDWHVGWQITVRVVAGAAVLGLAALLLVYTYAAVTLAVGDPFYEKIWREVENRLGDPPADSGDRLWASVKRGIGNSIRLVALAVLTALLLLVVGFIPVIGQVLAFTLGAVFGGWLLAVELTGFAFDARGLTLRERRRILASRRSTTIGFGVAAYLLFLIPFVAVIVMPVAVAGATLLSRNALAADERPRLAEERD